MICLRRGVSHRSMDITVIVRIVMEMKKVLVLSPIVRMVVTSIGVSCAAIEFAIKAAA